MAKADLTADHLRAILHYAPETGVFTRRVNFGKRFKAGTVAGFVMQSTGYAALSIGCKHYLAHRLAWLYMTGEWPADQVDHIDHCRTNNRWSNLREATNKQNCENSSDRADRLSGARGVYFWASRGKWVARIHHNGRKISLGHHATFDLAVAARKAAEIKYFTHSPASSLQPAYPDSLALPDGTPSACGEP